MALKCTAAMVVLLASPLVSAPPPRLVREIDLTKTVAALPGNALFAILAFSPDEKWLAVAVAPYRLEHHKSHGNVDLAPLESLLLAPVDGTAGQQVQVSPGLRPQWNLEWSPDSNTVLVEGLANTPLNPPVDAIATLWNLRGDELLRRPAPGFSVGHTLEPPAGGIFGFLDSKHLLARRNPAKGMPDAFETINLQGQVVDTWTVPKHWQVVDISPARSLVAILTDQDARTLVVDLPSKKVILTKNNLLASAAMPADT